MNNPSFTKKISPRTKTLLFITLLIIIGLAIGYVISQLSTPYLIDQIENPHPWKPSPPKLNPEDKNNLIMSYTITVEILTIDIALLIGLIWIYFNTYQKTKLKYLLGFELFVSVFLLKALAQLYAMTPLFAEPIRKAPGVIVPLTKNMFGPFGIYFTILEIIAICILIYLSRE